jgi:hypothetical protein
MKKKLIVGAVALGLGLTSFGAGSASAAPADGTCVAKGVSGLTGPAIAGAAKAGLVSFVILDHVFDGAAETGAITGAKC